MWRNSSELKPSLLASETMPTVVAQSGFRPQGMGKSAFLEEIKHHFETVGAAIIECRCHPNDDRPNGVFVELFAESVRLLKQARLNLNLWNGRSTDSLGSLTRPMSVSSLNGPMNTSGYRKQFVPRSWKSLLPTCPWSLFTTSIGRTMRRSTC